MAVSNTTTFTLNNGVKIPGLGFGTFANEGAKGETYKAVTCALKCGYRHLDCAWFYLNESEREDLFITTKVWNHLHEPEEVKWSLENSLSNFGLDYVDLFLVHWPMAAEKGDDEQAQDRPRRQTRAIGVSNWTIPGLKKMLGFAKVKPAVNQIEVHPFLPNNDLVKFCLENDILPEAYSPLGSQDQVPTTGEKVRTNKTLNDVADRSGHTLAQVLLAWGLRRGYAVLPKSSTPSRIESNFRVPSLSDADFEAVEGVAKGRHTRFVNMKDTFGYDVWPEESPEKGTSVA
ncbi:hypothetical protein NM208_g256 [Fusarium decemcellulare]|uniref:Uncharacterized protein n=1 Tax=Fusarium decemcellulare TaxID=57161 RepID=A0ACC1T0C4_9HYPO|nr:hypothetical protein NM208_g256 [Fusarium decemcellulare]